MKLAFWCSIFFAFLWFVSFVFGLFSFSFVLSLFVSSCVHPFYFFLVLSLYLSLSLSFSRVPRSDGSGGNEKHFPHLHLCPYIAGT